MQGDDFVAAYRSSGTSIVDFSEVPGENGSLMSIVHETVVGVRAALTGISKKTLPAFANGEQLIEYDDALHEMNSSDPKITEILTRQKESADEDCRMKTISA